jgi:hypothetical protein
MRGHVDERHNRVRGNVAVRGGREAEKIGEHGDEDGALGGVGSEGLAYLCGLHKDGLVCVLEEGRELGNGLGRRHQDSSESNCPAKEIKCLSFRGASILKFRKLLSSIGIFTVDIL